MALVCCSNGLEPDSREKIDRLCRTLSILGLNPALSPCLYAGESVFSGSARERAKALMDFYRDEEIKAVFDVSGGDIANEILPYLDFETIAKSGKSFWGYSDLTTVINAIYAKTGKKSVLYQVRNLVGKDGEMQTRCFRNSVLREQEDLFRFSWHFVQKERLEGCVAGGNIRCLLKLAGTEYWPDMEGKILLLEARGGTVPQMVTYLNQLKQMGVFEKIQGILLGTFTKMEEENCVPSIIDLVKEYAGDSLPIVKTEQIGHGADSRAILIGEKLRFERRSGSGFYTCKA